MQVSPAAFSESIGEPGLKDNGFRDGAGFLVPVGGTLLALATLMALRSRLAV